MSLYAATELAGYHDHAAGAKTLGGLGYLLVVNPVGAMLGGVFALGFGVAARDAPRWLASVSLGLGGLSVATALLGSVGGVGLLGLGPVVLWFLALSFWSAGRTSGVVLTLQVPAEDAV